MNRILIAAAFVLVAGPAFAAEVSIPVGAWFQAASEFLIAVLTAVVVWGLRKLPENVLAVINTLRVDQLLEKAIAYGINATKDAAKDKALNVEVANEVLAKAVQYAIDRAPTTILNWLGGEAKLREMIIARLTVVPEAAITP